MTFALDQIRRMALDGPVARVVIVASAGSVPREAGTAMLVTSGRCEGTIGGGTLEFEAIKAARLALSEDKARLDKRPLGPSLGQCCGGSVTTLTEIWTIERLDAIIRDFVARPLPGSSGEMPLSVRQIAAGIHAGQRDKSPALADGWIVERLSLTERAIWVWGAGHVGRALVGVLAPLPDLAINWADTDRSRFPDTIPDGVDILIAENPADLVSLAPPEAEHFVLTYSHALDLELCHRILNRPFRSLGLIGSATKRARFRTRLAALCHSEEQILRVVCPIGDPSLGKHPQAIALGVATSMLREIDEGTEMIGRSA